MTTVAANDREEWRRKRARRNAAWRHIVLAKGPDHPLFGEAFMRYYLLSHMTPTHPDGTKEIVEPADWHGDMWRSVLGSLNTGQSHAYLAPRLHAKTTIVSLALPLAVLGLSGLAIQKKLPFQFVPKHYVWIVRETKEAATEAMGSLLAETETNERVMQDFPFLVPALGRHKRPIADRDDDVVFQLDLRLQAVSSRQKVRGAKHRQYRPDLIIVDDLENDEQVQTKFQRDKTHRWLDSALGYAPSDYGDIHLIGTLLHHDAVLARVMKSPGWIGHRYEAFTDEEIPCPDHGVSLDPDREPVNGCDICDGVGVVRKPTWPARDHRWHAKRRLKNRKEYAREILHVVIDEDAQLFPPRFFQYVPDDLFSPERLAADEWRVRIGVDVGLTEKRQNDPSSIIVVAKRRGDRDHTVVEAWEGRLRGSRLKQRVIGAWKRWGGIVCFESTQAQVWGAEALQDEGVPVDPVHPAKDKVARAEPVALKYEQGQYHHVESLRDSEFERHLTEFPAGEAKHVVDALVHGDKGLSQEITAGVAGVVGEDDEEEFRDPRGE